MGIQRSFRYRSLGLTLRASLPPIFKPLGVASMNFIHGFGLIHPSANHDVLNRFRITNIIERVAGKNNQVGEFAFL